VVPAARSAEGAAGRAAPGSDQGLQGFQRGELSGVGGQLEQAVDQDKAEEFRRGPGRVSHLPGGAGILSTGRPSPRLGPVDAVQCRGQVADDVTFPGHQVAAPLAALIMPPGPGPRAARRAALSAARCPAPVARVGQPPAGA